MDALTACALWKGVEREGFRGRAKGAHRGMQLSVSGARSEIGMWRRIIAERRRERTLLGLFDIRAFFALFLLQQDRHRPDRTTRRGSSRLVEARLVSSRRGASSQIPSSTLHYAHATASSTSVRLGFAGCPDAPTTTAAAPSSSSAFRASTTVERAASLFGLWREGWGEGEVASAMDGMEWIR